MNDVWSLPTDTAYCNYQLQRLQDNDLISYGYNGTDNGSHIRGIAETLYKAIFFKADHYLASRLRELKFKLPKRFSNNSRDLVHIQEFIAKSKTLQKLVLSLPKAYTIDESHVQERFVRAVQRSSSIESFDLDIAGLDYPMDRDEMWAEFAKLYYPWDPVCDLLLANKTNLKVVKLDGIGPLPPPRLQQLSLALARNHHLQELMLFGFEFSHGGYQPAETPRSLVPKLSVEQCTFHEEGGVHCLLQAFGNAREISWSIDHDMCNDKWFFDGLTAANNRSLESLHFGGITEAGDTIGRWLAGYLHSHPDCSLKTIHMDNDATHNYPENKFLIQAIGEVRPRALTDVRFSSRFHMDDEYVEPLHGSYLTTLCLGTLYGCENIVGVLSHDDCRVQELELHMDVPPEDFPLFCQAMATNQSVQSLTFDTRFEGDQYTLDPLRQYLPSWSLQKLHLTLAWRHLRPVIEILADHAPQTLHEVALGDSDRLSEGVANNDVAVAISNWLEKPSCTLQKLSLYDANIENGLVNILGSLSRKDATLRSLFYQRAKYQCLSKAEVQTLVRILPEIHSLKELSVRPFTTIARERGSDQDYKSNLLHALHKNTSLEKFDTDADPDGYSFNLEVAKVIRRNEFDPNLVRHDNLLGAWPMFMARSDASPTLVYQVLRSLVPRHRVFQDETE